MLQTISAFVGLFCMFGWVSVGQCVFSDELSLLQETAHALPQEQKWPDISKIVDEVKEAADAASDTAKQVNETVHDKLDQAANEASTAIQTVVQTVQFRLQTILRHADDFDKNMKKAVDTFLQSVETSPQLHTFELAANQTLEAFNASLSPIASALDTSIATAQDVLSGSGYHDLSEDMGAALTAAMGAINKANLTYTQLKQIVEDLDAKVNKSAGNLSSEIDDDLTSINEQLHELVEEVNATFVGKIMEGYEMLATRLRESVEAFLPEEHLKQVVDSLETLAPVAKNITGHMADSIQSMETGFDDAVSEIREHVPASARHAVGFSFLALVVSMFTSLITL